MDVEDQAGPGRPGVRVDCVTGAGLAVTRRLPAEVRGRLDVRDCTPETALAAPASPG